MVYVRSGDRRGLVEQGLPEVVWDPIGDARLGQGGGPPQLAASQKFKAVCRRGERRQCDHVCMWGSFEVF